MKLSLLAIALFAGACHAGTIYTPVQYEYGSGNDRYYYGGSNPQVHARAQRNAAARKLTHGVADSKPQVYTDKLPYHGNAAVYGVTASDARDEAYARVPRYFRMSPAAAVRETPKTTRPGVILIIPKKSPDKQSVAAAR